MAFLRRSLAQRFLKFTKCSSQSSSSVSPRIISSSPSNNKPDIAPEPGDSSIFRRFLHKHTLFMPEFRSSLLHADNNNNVGVVDQLKAINIVGNRIRLDGLVPPVEKSDVAVSDLRKLLKVARLELVKSKLREVSENWITYDKFLQICKEFCYDDDQAKWTAKMLDDSAAVIVLGDVVFLRPDEEIETLLFRRV